MENWKKCFGDSWLLAAALLLEWQIRQCRIRPNDFAEFAFTTAGGKPLRQAAIHRELQEFLTLHVRALVELPRDHGKSMQVCMRVLWELGRQPGLRIKIVCASEALAADRSRFLRDALAGSERVRLVFPHLVPAQPWSATRFSIRRPAEKIGPSVTAFGVGASSTGTRADLLVCDDIVDVKAIRSRSDRERVKLFFRENLVNLLEPHGRLWNIFTPWHRDDLNAELKQNPAFALFKRAIDENLTPIWPEHWPRERLEARRAEIGEVSFARAYRLVTISEEEIMIRPEWVQFWLEPVEYKRIILSVDPALSSKQSADASALVTLGIAANGEIHCLEALARRVTTPQLVELIADADDRLRPEAILFEANAAFTGIAELLVRHTRFGAKIHKITQSKDKASRVRAFSVPVENGTFLLKGTKGHVAPEQMELFDEITTFPLGDHDDLLDAASTGTLFLMPQREPRAW
jgi:predicted phage terminase large subunit-like protein